MSELSELRLRLDRLERDNRRWKRVAGVGALLVTALACGASTAPAVEPGSQVVEAERFVLRGPDGEEAAILGTDSRGMPSLVLRQERASALLVPGQGLVVRGDDGKRGAYIGVDTGGVATVSLQSERLTDGVRLRAKPDGSAGIYALGVGGFEQAAIESLSDGSTHFSVRSETGKLRALMGMGPNRAPGVILYDELQRQRAGIALDTDGAPTFEMLDESSAPRAQLQMKFDGATSLRILRADGEAAYQVP